jgi:hypothetical protein
MVAGERLASRKRKLGKDLSRRVLDRAVPPDTKTACNGMQRHAMGCCRMQCLAKPPIDSACPHWTVRFWDSQDETLGSSTPQRLVGSQPLTGGNRATSASAGSEVGIVGKLPRHGQGRACQQLGQRRIVRGQAAAQVAARRSRGQGGHGSPFTARRSRLPPRRLPAPGCRTGRDGFTSSRRIPGPAASWTGAPHGRLPFALFVVVGRASTIPFSHLLGYHTTVPVPPDR